MNHDWSGIYGQDNVKEILSKLISSVKIPHAFIFEGSEGIGKYAISLRLAQIINNKFLPDKPQISNLIANLTEPYVKYIIPLPRGKNETDEHGPIETLSNDDIKELKNHLENKVSNPYYSFKMESANKIKINSIREISKFLSYNYEDVKYRFIIISDAHLMNDESQNALLKNLEEPPEGVVFILLTPYPDHLRDTIKSRCWRINFQPLNENDIKSILITYFEIDENTAEDVAAFSFGSVSKAIELIDNNFNNLKEKTISIMRNSFGGKFHSALTELNSLVSDNSDSMRLLIQMIITWLNDIQKYQVGQEKIYFKSHFETIEKFNLKFPGLKLNDTIVKLDNLSTILRNNINPNLISLYLIYELASLTKRLHK